MGAGVLCLPLSFPALASPALLPRGLLDVGAELVGDDAGDARELLDLRGDLLDLDPPWRPVFFTTVSVTTPEPLAAEALRGRAADCGDAAPSAAAGAAIAVAMAPAGSDSEESVSLLRPNVAVESESMLVGFFLRREYSTADNLSMRQDSANHSRATLNPDSNNNQQ